MAEPEPEPASDAICVYTHNMLADAWVQYGRDGGRSYYPGIAPELLDAQTRRQLSIAAVLRAQADVVCLQEIGVSDVAALAASALAAEYRFTGLVENPESVAREPNGVLLLLRRATIGASSTLRSVHFPATAERDGFAVGVARCRHLPSGQELRVINSHIDYGPRGGLTMLKAVLAHLAPELGDDPAALLTLWCGDFNQQPESEAMEHLRRVGFSDVLGFDPAQHTATGQQQGGAVRIDYILFAQNLAARLQASEPAEAAAEPTDDGGAKVGAGSAEVWGLPPGEPVGCEMLLRAVGSDHAPLRATLALL